MTRSTRPGSIFAMASRSGTRGERRPVGRVAEQRLGRDRKVGHASSCGEIASCRARGCRERPDHDQSATRARCDADCLGGLRRVVGREGMGKARAADEEDRSCVRQARPSNAAEILFRLSIADGDHAAPGGHPRERGREVAAHGREWKRLGPDVGRGEDRRKVGTGIGVIAMPDLRLFQRTTVDADATTDRRPARRREGGRADPEARPRPRFQGRDRCGRLGSRLASQC